MRTEHWTDNGVTLYHQTDKTRAHVRELVDKGTLMIKGDETLLAAARQGWSSINAAVEESVQGKKLASYEVHHLRMTAHDWFIADIAEGKAINDAVQHVATCLEVGFR